MSFIKNTKQQNAIKNMFLYFIMILLCVYFVFPLIWMLFTALKPVSEAYELPLKIFPRHITFSNFIRGWREVTFTRFLINTILVAIPAVFGTLLSASLVAYGFSRFKTRYSGFLFSLLLATMMIPQQITLIPTYLIWSRLHLIDTYVTLILPSWLGGGAFNIFLLRQFINSVPRELDEAAFIDGANSFQIYSFIMIPCIRPALTAVGIMSAVYHWNDFFNPLIYLTSKKNFTIALGLQFFQSSYGGNTNYQLMLAVAFVSLIPLIVLFLFCQRYFIQGITTTGIKG
ncbi:multiple sugar transport system permease protein [Pillotina sp. SPG140]